MGASCGEEGSSFMIGWISGVFPGSRCSQAEELLHKDPKLNHEYLPITGLADFTTAAQKLILGADSPTIKDKRVHFLTPPPLDLS